MIGNQRADPRPRRVPLRSAAGRSRCRRREGVRRARLVDFLHAREAVTSRWLDPAPRRYQTSASREQLCPGAPRLPRPRSTEGPRRGIRRSGVFGGRDGSTAARHPSFLRLRRARPARPRHPSCRRADGSAERRSGPSLRRQAQGVPELGTPPRRSRDRDRGAGGRAVDAVRSVVPMDAEGPAASCHEPLCSSQTSSMRRSSGSSSRVEEHATRDVVGARLLEVTRMPEPASSSKKTIGCRADARSCRAAGFAERGSDLIPVHAG